jgi:hypothetical protein
VSGSLPALAHSAIRSSLPPLASPPPPRPRPACERTNGWPFAPAHGLRTMRANGKRPVKCTFKPGRGRGNMVRDSSSFPAAGLNVPGSSELRRLGGCRGPGGHRGLVAAHPLEEGSWSRLAPGPIAAGTAMAVTTGSRGRPSPVGAPPAPVSAPRCFRAVALGTPIPRQDIPHPTAGRVRTGADPDHCPSASGSEGTTRYDPAFSIPIGTQLGPARIACQ